MKDLAEMALNLAKGKVEGRAETNEEKRAIIERVYQAWIANPYLRLGQLIVNAAPCIMEDDTYIFYVEDETLAKQVETFDPTKKKAGTQETK